MKIKILEHDWYDGYIRGLCLTKNNEVKYFHWMEGGLKEDNYIRIYFVYDIDYIPQIESWKELSQFKQIGQFTDYDL